MEFLRTNPLFLAIRPIAKEIIMKTQQSPEAALLTDIMLAIFRVNGRLLEKGDQLVRPINLTSSRWQVLGAVALARKPLSAPQIAEAMGITRQGVQKQLNRLVKENLLEQQHNPRHERSPLYLLTETGLRSFGEAMVLEALWANKLVAGLSRPDLEATQRTLNAIHDRLDSPIPQKGDSS
jgi:DNA-binding MarR family transcriptional regulator